MNLPVPVGVRNVPVRAVTDDEYFSVVESIIMHSRIRCWCSLFIVDLWPSRDPELLVDQLLQELRAAAWRGCDVRLLLGGSRSNFAIAELTVLARQRAFDLGIPVRWLTAKRRRGSHVKLVIADDHVLTGSHNWSAGACTDQTQDSVWVASSALAAWFAIQFESTWKRAKGEKNASI